MIIDQIPKGGGGVDTSDATATAEDILSGKTAYADDVKLTGSFVPLDTSDATATASDIASGKTAYVDGSKLTGSLTSHTTTIDGTIQNRDVDLKSGRLDAILPYKFSNGNAVVYNNELHIFTFSNFYHYKWDGFTWDIASTPPGEPNSTVVVYDNAIHIFCDDGNHYKWNGTTWSEASTLPEDISGYSCRVVVHNNEMHAIGGSYQDEETYEGSEYHYKWDGANWTYLGVTLDESPDSNTSNHSTIVSFGNKIHLFGEYNSETTHYTWNGSTWSVESTMPFKAYAAAVYDGEIHIFCPSNDNYTMTHCKYNGDTTWSSVTVRPYYSSNNCYYISYNNKLFMIGGFSVSSAVIDYDKTSEYLLTEWDGSGDYVPGWLTKDNTPSSFYNGCAVTLNGDIHILGSMNSSAYKKHSKWDGTSWTATVSTLPYNFYCGSAVVLNGEIHILGGNGGNTKHYKWNGSTWTSVSTIPHQFNYGGAVVLNDEIHILGSNSSSHNKKHYKWNGTSWVSVSTIPYGFIGKAVVLNNEIHILGGSSYDNTKYHYKWNGSTWTSVSTTPFDMDHYADAIVYDSKIHIFYGMTNNNVRRGHYAWNGTSWEIVTILPYKFSSGCVAVQNNELHLLGGNDSSPYTKHMALPASEYTRSKTIDLNDVSCFEKTSIQCYAEV